MLIVEGKLQRAERTLDDFLDKYPSNLAAHALLGYTYDSRGMYDKAEEEYRKGGKPGALYLAFSYAARRRTKDAKRTLEESIGEEAEPIPVLYDINIILNPTGRSYERVKRDFNKIMNIDDPEQLEKACKAFITPSRLMIIIQFYKDVIIPRKRKPKVMII
jgi:tetratricopeptide (TPR) repeat protein